MNTLMFQSVEMQTTIHWNDRHYEPRFCPTTSFLEKRLIKANHESKLIKASSSELRNVMQDPLHCGDNLVGFLDRYTNFTLSMPCSNYAPILSSQLSSTNLSMTATHSPMSLCRPCTRSNQSGSWWWCRWWWTSHLWSLTRSDWHSGAHRKLGAWKLATLHGVCALKELCILLVQDCEDWRKVIWAKSLLATFIAKSSQLAWVCRTQGAKRKDGAGDRRRIEVLQCLDCLQPTEDNFEHFGYSWSNKRVDTHKKAIPNAWKL